MCGIIGIMGQADASPLIMDALKRLEYRGYDSAGIATLINGGIHRRRAEGKLKNLEALLGEDPLSGTVGIGHTRWATHGVPNEANAHPHATSDVAIVHNGIIENYRELRAEATAAGCNLASDTDTEVVAHLITQEIKHGKPPIEATESVLKRLEGAFALAIIFAGHHNLMIGARRGSPLAIGFGDGEMFVGSDALALAPLTNQIMYLEDGDWAVIRPDGAEVRNIEGAVVSRDIRRTELSGAAIGKGGFRHFMLKEIYEQPQVMGDTLHTYINPAARTITIPDLPFDPKTLTRLTLVACGTSYYACMTARYWLEDLLQIPVDVDIASEFRYRRAPLPEGGAALFISQSGETVDTLAALKYAKGAGQKIVSIVNVPESAIARESDLVLRTKAGPEIGVASTKAFTTQLMVLACLAIAMGRLRGAISQEKETELTQALTEVPSRANDVLNHDARLKDIATQVADARDVLYLGRGTSYPIALEGALKLKEISYIHAEGYAAGEMKHGPIALIDDQVPVIAIAPTDELFEKTASNVQEVLARGGRVICMSDEAGLSHLQDGTLAAVSMPTVHPFVTPLLYAIPIQLLAYHVAVCKGTDVDQPRNLAKSVTVE